MNPQIPILASLCVSLAGHDKGRTYVIIKIIDPEFVLVADGVYRGMKNPKKKRVKHLKIAFDSSEDKLLAKIAEGDIKDNELHKFILANTALTTPGGVLCQEKTVSKPKA